jgi:predicted metal-dependent hydrolase
MITEQAPPYAPSAKGTVETLFRWMTERFEKRLPNTSYGVHDAERAAQAGGMTLEELERCFYQAIVDDYQQAFDGNAPVCYGNWRWHRAECHSTWARLMI